MVAARELARAVDNPVITHDGRVESNGNFHGAPLAYVLDFLAIVAADLASMSERRTDRFLDVARSHGLPAFLADDPGVDSGHMLAQYTQAAIVSELKRLAAPASVDSIPSSAMQEDHVSMGWSAGRKLRRAIDGLTQVLAIELLTAARGISCALRSRPPPATAAVIAALRETTPGPGPTGSWRRRSKPPSSFVSAAAPSARRGVSDRSAGMSSDSGSRYAPRAVPSCPAAAGSRRPPCACCRTTSTPRSPSTPQDLVVYGGTGKAARDWPSFDAIVRTLQTLGDDETLLVQSGKPVGVLSTHEWAPRVLIANSNLVGDWAPGRSSAASRRSG